MFFMEIIFTMYTDRDTILSIKLSEWIDFSTITASSSLLLEASAEWLLVFDDSPQPDKPLNVQG